MSDSTALVFATPRKLPKAARLQGNVVVLDIAFAGTSPSGGFEQVTLPLINGLGGRLRAWVDHHDHAEHRRYERDPRFVLSTKAEHGACPEMISEALVTRVGPVDTIVCHGDFDGLASAAKWLRGGQEPYLGCDADARAIDTRIGEPGPEASIVDRALRARPKDPSLQPLIVRYLQGGAVDAEAGRLLRSVASELEPIERETERAAREYRVLGGLALVDVAVGFDRIDTTLLLLLGQRLARVAVVLDRANIHMAASFDSGVDFLKLLKIPGGMPTRLALPRNQAVTALVTLGLDPQAASEFGG
jgi:hypothetical protein